MILIGNTDSLNCKKIIPFLEWMNYKPVKNNHIVGTEDIVISFDHYIDTKQHPYTKFLFFSSTRFPSIDIEKLKDNKNCVVINQSQWKYDLWYNLGTCAFTNMKVMPIPLKKVDKEVRKENKLFLIINNRPHEEEHFIKCFVQRRLKLDHKIFNKDNVDYKYISECKYGIVCSGYSFQYDVFDYAISQNVPLFVWDIEKMSDDLSMSHPKIYATSMPHWNDMCGKRVFSNENFLSNWNEFETNLLKYTPQSYFNSHMSYESCLAKFKDIIDDIVVKPREEVVSIPEYIIKNNETKKYEIVRNSDNNATNECEIVGNSDNNAAKECEIVGNSEYEDTTCNINCCVRWW